MLLVMKQMHVVFSVADSVRFVALAVARYHHGILLLPLVSELFGHFDL